MTKTNIKKLAAAGAIISAVLLYSLKKSKILHNMQESLNR